ncbi:hypothetical protein HGM15179_019261 [Zosterops borbonicus]|uniref:VLIG-type G domain-containing protein n=1 Tax=Zosterops borbonicus TaxID=364589 RepID=A0A8K1DBT1_9PASS|nr:hypothetical protein HGM15179_019261 [Zosterops borbonicus]
MKRQTSEALNIFVGASWGGFGASAAEALDVSKSSSQASVLGRAGESSRTAIQLSMVNTGGPPDTASLPQWKTGLVSDNTTWCVIDRGFELIPVWDIILYNHSGDFKSVGQMSSALRAAYKELTNQSIDTIFGEELGSAVQEARDFMRTVKAWEVSVDERKLRRLMGLKDDLNAKTRSHNVWINVCLSDKALQDFLVNTVRSCQESPPENTSSIKAMLRSLLDPHIYSVKDFPEASFIMQWIFQTGHSLPRSPKVSELGELIKTLQQMKEHIHAVTYAPGSSASAIHEAKIEATLTSSLAIYSFLQSLQERAQKDMELLVLLIAISTGYQVESSTFQHLLGHPEIQYMAKEMEAAHEKYVNLKEQDADRAEASLLLTGLTVTSKSQELSPEQKRERLVFMEDHMKGLWSPRIKNLLQKHSEGEDWERLERDLHSLISGCLHDKSDEQRMQNINRDLEAGQASKNATIGIKNRNEAELIDQLTKTIGNLLEGSNSHFSLDACVDKARQHGFVVDADEPACVTAKAKAKELVDLLKKKKLSEIKSQLLPLQGKLWNEWCKKDKELTRLQEKGDKSIEHHRSQIENEKKAIREKQLDQAFPLNPLMKSFLGFLQTQSAATKKYFLQWMKVFMDELSCGCLEELRRDYHELWSEILAQKKSKEKGSVNDQCLRRLDALSDEINDSSISLEHLLREVGQIYESLELVKRNNYNCVTLPDVAAELMVSGYPVELMDGDASYLPLRWVGAIFDRLIERLGDKRVFVLSVLGIQSTGKSTLLNAMFGLQFSVSAGRCTRGAFMQLIPVGQELQQDLGFDFVLVVDTEGLRAIEVANKQSLNHDNELATFVIGVGNMTVINIFGENPSEMQDVLQIAVQAFLRMKKVNLSPSCIFVHQNVGEATAKEQNMEGQRRLQEKLDEMTVIAAQQEFCDVSSFNDVIGFDVKTHIHYFSHLWEGNPPMAPPNPTYSQNVQQLKSKILQAAQKQSQSSILRLSSLKVRIGDLWNALLNENFVFSFKNSLEIAAYRNLESAFSQWTWKLRSHILDIQMRLDNKIRNGDLQNVTTAHFEGLVQETSDAIEKEVEKYFREDKDCETLVQWKSSTERKLKDLKETLLHETKKKCENLIELQKEQSKLDAKKLKYENDLLRKSRELAVTLKGKSLSERELRDNFTLVWNKWIAEVSRTAPPPERVDIDAEIEGVLLDHFKEPGFHERIRSFPEGRGFSFDKEKHITKKKYFGFIPDPRSISNADVINFQHITDKIIESVKANIDKKEQEKRDYSRSFIHEILNEVQKGVNSVPSDAKYTFNREYSMDLSLYLCKMAADRFKAMHEAFQKANDPVVYLSSKREDFFQCFQISCQGATSVTTFAVFLCDKIEPALRQAVYERTAKAIAEDMQGKFLDFRGNRANLEVSILKYLAEQENFEYFKQYLMFPKEFFQSYIERRVKNHCLDGSRRLEKFLDYSLSLLYGNILSAVSLSSQIVKDRTDKEDKVSLWLDEFCGELREVISLPRSDLKGIEHQEVSDIEFLSSAMADNLDDLRDRLQKEFAGADMNSFSTQPHTILAEHFSGCWEQCPFCGAVCTNIMQGHDGDHQLVFHRPKESVTTNRSLDICSSLVASDCTFRIGDNESIPYKRYRDAGPPYSTWNILPDPSMQAYWKWFVSHFQTQLEASYNRKFQGKGEIPEAWRRITKEEALSELDKH